MDHEAQLVAAVMATGDVTAPRRVGVAPDWFENVEAGRVLAAIYDYASRPATLGQVPGLAYVQQLGIPFHAVHDPVAGNVASLCEAMRLVRLRRLVTAAASEVAAAAMMDPAEAFERWLAFPSRKEVSGLVSRGRGSQLAHLFPQVMAQYRAEQAGQGMGLSTPFAALTDCTGGLQPGDFWVVFGPPKNMKTWVAVAFFVHLYRQGRRILVVSSEMTDVHVASRAVAMIYGVDYDGWRARTLDSASIDEMEGDVEAFKAREGLDWHFFQPSPRGGLQAVAEVKSEIARLNSDGKLAAVLWDGHYRSAKSDEWEDVYDLVRASRQIPLDKSLGQVPMLATTQEGSTAGRASYRAYEQEVTTMLRASIQPGGLTLATTALREGRNCVVTLRFDATTTAFVEVSSTQEGADGVGWS